MAEPKFSRSCPRCVAEKGEVFPSPCSSTWSSSRGEALPIRYTYLTSRLKLAPIYKVKHLSFPHSPCTGRRFQDSGDGRGGHLCSTLTHPRGSPAHKSHQKCHCHTSRNCKSSGSATSLTHHPLHDLIYKAKALWQNSSHSVQMSVEQTALLALAPFPSGCSSSGTDVAQRMSSSLFQVEFALGNLPGNQNKLLNWFITDLLVVCLSV